ncbi:hypothetical protein Cantr_07470 [Candida viswanathii]|uniref:Uncharacterized protein n=1 Tax=Candida viswanathii TaxID=5486 RepID=A0A367Y1K3_9ASCO|nr:hypothetical protein Cantr_07470 [Candida viswanathii]
MEDKSKRRLSILHPLTNKNSQSSTTAAAAAAATNTTTTATSANNTIAAVIASTTNSIGNPSPNPQLARSLNYPPSYNYSSLNPAANNPNNRIHLGFGLPPDAYIYVKGYNGKPGSDSDQIPRYVPHDYNPKRANTTLATQLNLQETSHHPNLSYNVPTNQPQFNSLLPQQIKNETSTATTTNNLQVSNLEIYNNLNPRKSPNMNYKEKITNWMASIPQFNNSENNEIYIDCYPGVVSTSGTPSTSDDEIDLSDVEDILELQAQKVTRYVTRLYIHEVENSNLSRDRHGREGDEDEDEEEEEDEDDDEDEDEDENEEEDEDEVDMQKGEGGAHEKNGRRHYGFRDVGLPIAFDIN